MEIHCEIEFLLQRPGESPFINSVGFDLETPPGIDPDDFGEFGLPFCEHWVISHRRFLRRESLFMFSGAGALAYQNQPPSPLSPHLPVYPPLKTCQGNPLFVCRKSRGGHHAYLWGLQSIAWWFGGHGTSEICSIILPREPHMWKFNYINCLDVNSLDFWVCLKMMTSLSYCICYVLL